MARRRRLNREIVAAQAAAMADAQGDVEAVSLTTLAEALGVRAPSLYNHVASLSDLHLAMAVVTRRRFNAALRQAALGKVGREALLAMAEVYRRFALAHPGTYPLTIRAPAADEAELTALSDELLHMLQLIMASLGLTGEDALHAIRGLRAVLHGFTSLESAEGYRLPLDHDESFRRLLKSYLDGLI